MNGELRVTMQRHHLLCSRLSTFHFQFSTSSIGFGITILFPFLRLLSDNRLHG